MSIRPGLLTMAVLSWDRARLARGNASDADRQRLPHELLTREAVLS